jgi:hypothetical protein
MNGLTGDPRKCNTTHTRLAVRLRIKSNVYQMRFMCKRCEESEVLDDDDDTEAESEPTRKINLGHCHCSLWKPSDDLVASTSGGQPRSKREEKEEKAKKRKEKRQRLYFCD